MKHPRIVNDRNDCGVKNSSDQYRTFNGEHYICWIFGRKRGDLVEYAKSYRAAGLRCRRIGDDLYLHHQDREAALTLDQAAKRD